MIYFILGGARSGKSSQARKIATNHSEVTFLATGLPSDGEMKKRIARHKRDRPANWKTIEQPLEIDKALSKLAKKGFSGAVILDCLGFWITNLMEKACSKNKQTAENLVSKKTEKAISTARKANFDFIVVSNETGMGVVPPYKSGRQFRDIIGRANQKWAEAADKVYLMIAGQRMEVK